MSSNPPTYGIERHGISNPGVVYRNLSTPRLYEEALIRREGRLSHLGPLVVRTGQYTGRSPDDRFIVSGPGADQVWWGKVNRAIEPRLYSGLKGRLLAYLQGKDLFVQDCFVGADPAYRKPIRVITETAWHSLFARNLFIQAAPDELAGHTPEFTVIHAPHFHAVPEVDGTRSEVFIILDFDEHVVLIGGTQYAGEIKKSIFSALNYLLPQKGVLTMHAAANTGPSGDAAIFLGLSGTGKTSLSTDTSRTLVGDDEHGWSVDGLFNFEGGCYAKVIRISAVSEPEIYETTRKFGTILENVGFDAVTGKLDLNDDTLTENTRAAYPISHIPNATRTGRAGHPGHVVMLTADAFGVLPPIARLNPSEAMYHFLSGYTAKVAGTEKGVTEPRAVFSPCFGAPFMTLSPTVYADLLGERIREHDVAVWLVNTGWSGGPYRVGRRMKIEYTRAMIAAALGGHLAEASYRKDPAFGFEVPRSCPGVPHDVLDPRDTWDDKSAYDAQAAKLAALFAENFETFRDEVSDDVAEAGPRAGASAGTSAGAQKARKARPRR